MNRDIPLDSVADYLESFALVGHRQRKEFSRTMGSHRGRWAVTADGRAGQTIGTNPQDDRIAPDLAMTLTIALSPEIASALQAEAVRRGLTPGECVGEALNEWLRGAAIEAEQDEEDAAEARRILAPSDPSKRRTLAELKAWRK